MILLFLLLTMLTCMLFFVTLNPLSLGVILIFKTLLLSILLSTMTSAPWFLYIVILVFIGGMLVLFIYVTSIFPNEKFSFDQNTLILMIIYMTTLLFTFMMYNYLFNSNNNMNSMEIMLNMKMNYNMINTSKMFSSQTNLILIFLVNYLFYCMIVVIKITNHYKGPLRKMNYV